ncbi:MAG: hypothetical protein EBV31_06690 [Verrucomicrobia bacterium]|jgi:hypothetical protein|nr:hypothetical protein [Verrucomicrobiota bacterium]
MRPLFLLSASLLAFGCKPAPQVARYEVKSEAAPAAPAPAPATQAPAAAPAPTAPMVAPASMKAEAASFDAPKWAKLPAGWSVGPENSMRKATWIVTGPNGSTAEIAVTVFPGNVGGLTANVNRWRGQVGLSPASADEIAASAKAGKVGGIDSQRFVMTSPDGKTALDAFMTPKDGATWFFKMKGDTAAVEANAASFATFLSASQLP